MNHPTRQTSSGPDSLKDRCTDATDRYARVLRDEIRYLEVELASMKQRRSAIERSRLPWWSRARRVQAFRALLARLLAR